MKYLLFLSLFLYIISLFVPCLSFVVWFSPIEYSGWQTLAYGYMVFGEYQFAWLANPLYFISLVLSLIRVSRVTLGLSILASLLTLNTFTWKYDIYFGAYVWMASIFIFTLAQFLYLKKSAA